MKYLLIIAEGWDIVFYIDVRAVSRNPIIKKMAWTIILEDENKEQLNAVSEELDFDALKDESKKCTTGPGGPYTQCASASYCGMNFCQDGSPCNMGNGVCGPDCENGGCQGTELCEN